MDILTYGLLNKKVEEAKNVSGEKITEAVNTYLDENPPTTGATAEQAAQINKNVADIDGLKSDLDNQYETLIKSIIENLNTPVSFNIIGGRVKNAYVYNGSIFSIDNSDIAIAKVKEDTQYVIFIGGDSVDGWRNKDKDIVYYCNTYFFDKDFKYLSENNKALDDPGVSGNGVSLIGKLVTTPTECCYIVQRYKKGYLDYAVITDLSYSLIASYNMEYCWKQSCGNSHYDLKPYFAPRTMYNNDNILVLDNNRNSTYPIRVFPNKSYKISGGGNRENICVEFDSNMNFISRKEINAVDGYFIVTTNDKTNFIAISYDNTTDIYPQYFTIEEYDNFRVIANTESDLIQLLEVGGVIELVPGKRYVFNDSITFNQDTTTLIGNGAILDFSSIKDDSCGIRVISKKGKDDSGLILGTLRNQAVHWIESCYIVGGNLTPNFEDGRKGIGILFLGDDQTLQNSAFLTIRNCTIAGFHAGAVHRSQSWCVTYDSCNINVCDIGLSVSYGYKNYGEKISLVNSVVNTCSLGLVVSYGNATVQCLNTSFDYNFMSIKTEGGGKVFVSNCHIETTKDKGYVIDATGDGKILIANTEFYIGQSNYAFAHVGATGKIVVKDCMRELWVTPENVVESGGVYEESWLNEGSV